MSRIRKALQNFQKTILKQNEIEEAPRKYDFKGQRYIAKQPNEGPGLTREQYESQFKLDPPMEPQPRAIRAKNVGYLFLYTSWYIGIIAFIMYRLGGDELKIMEREAEERIKLREAMKQQRDDYKYKKQ